VEADFGADLGGRMVALSGRCAERGVRLIERHQIECGIAVRDAARRFAKRDRLRFSRFGQQGGCGGCAGRVLESDAARATGTGPLCLALMLDRRGGQVNRLVMRGASREAAMQAGAAP
jgi:hypothetical protein